MPKVNEVEVKVDQSYVYLYCDDCCSKVPDFITDTMRVVAVDDGETIVCDGCGKEIEDASA